jgi:hypothetical protein
MLKKTYELPEVGQQLRPKYARAILTNTKHFERKIGVKFYLSILYVEM